jgi:hypothetical protein
MHPAATQRLLASPEGFKTQFWGPSGWRLIHLAALNFPLEPVGDEKVRDAYYNFFNSLCYILPCGACRKEFCKIVRDPRNPLYLHKGLFRLDRQGSAWSTRERLFKWTINLHLKVNKRLSTTSSRAAHQRQQSKFSNLPYAHWLRYYLKMRARPSKASSQHKT